MFTREIKETFSHFTKIVFTKVFFLQNVALIIFSAGIWFQSDHKHFNYQIDYVILSPAPRIFICFKFKILIIWRYYKTFSYIYFPVLNWYWKLFLKENFQTKHAIVAWKFHAIISPWNNKNYIVMLLVSLFSWSCPTNFHHLWKETLQQYTKQRLVKVCFLFSNLFFFFLSTPMYLYLNDAALPPCARNTKPFLREEETSWSCFPSKDRDSW